MRNKIWALGDVHGCYRELMALYDKLLEAGLQPEKDIVVVIGDLIDRGYDSKSVVEQCMKWHKKYKHWQFIYGNHEDILKNWLEGGQKYQEDSSWSCFLYNGGKETLKSYGISEAVKHLFPINHLDFLFNETKMLYETDNYVFVHAGLVPGLSISKHLSKIKEEYESYTNAMLWAREGFIDNPYDWGKKIIFGHTPAYKLNWGSFGQPIIMKNKIGIDGAICSKKLDGNLIAIELPEERFYYQESLSLYDNL